VPALIDHSAWADELTKIAKERWLKVESYRSRGSKGEMVLKARKKRYWFPISPKAYKVFRRKLSGSQSSALKFAKRYIRKGVEVPYKGVWKGTLSRYYMRNRLPRFIRSKRWDVSGDKRTFK